MQEVIDSFARDRFAKLLGAELLAAGPGYARARLVLREDHLNAYDVVHGGVTFALADFTFGAAAASRGTVALAVQASITFMHAAREGVLVAEAKELSRGRAIGNYEVTITDDSGKTIAVFVGVSYDKGTPLPASRPR